MVQVCKTTPEAFERDEAGDALQQKWGNVTGKNEL
jgi:hypothetical protein